jgi:chloramphenicol 3-O phosphotransferase
MARIILLHGASSSGKTSIAVELQKMMDTPFLFFSSDQLVAAKLLPVVDRSGSSGPFSWKAIRPRFFDGFHRCIRALADANNDLIVEHIVEMKSWLDDCVSHLAAHEVFYVGVHCDLKELERRERERGDRQIGEAKSHLADDQIHSFSGYDFEVDSTSVPGTANALAIKKAFQAQRGQGVFERLRDPSK